MRTTRTKIARVAAALTLAVSLGALAPTAAHAGDGLYRDRWQMKKATNTSRVNHGVQRVDLNDRLSELARRHSVKMAAANDLFHTADPGSYYLKGMTWHYWGENVGVTGGSIPELEQAFMASTYHRANILNKGFRHVAIGTARADGKLWVTVFFWG